MNRKIAVIDAETDPFASGRVPQPFLWGFYDGERYETFTNTVALAEFLHDQEMIVYAHNGGRFDFHFLLPYLNEFSDLFVINGRIASARLGLCELRDSFCILPVPLAAYKKDDIDYEIMETEERHKPENWKKINDYLYGDCVYLFDLVNAFIAEYGTHMTLAAASMASWKELAERKPPNSGAGFYAMFKEFYFGGRVQCFQSGHITRPFTMIDIKSAYPYAMLHQHPISIEHETLYNHVPSDDARVGPSLVKVACEARGCFPWRDEDTGKLTFPTDRKRRVYCVSGYEYLAARDTGAMKNPMIQECKVFDETINFAPYINHHFERRQQAKAAGDKARDLFSKLFMNSLYGKFGSNPERYLKYVICDPAFANQVAEDGYEPGGIIGPWMLAQRKLQFFEQRFYNVATAASITGFVRAYLWRALATVNGAIYCDTDSIAAFDVSAIELGDALGDWEQDGEFSEGYIGGRKLYAFRHSDPDHDPPWKIASKGVRLDAAQIARIARGGEIEHEPMVPTFSVNKPPRFTKRRITRTTGT